MDFVENDIVFLGSFITHAVFITLSQTQKEVRRKNESCSLMSNSLRPHGLYSPWNSPGQNTGVGGLSILQGIFSAQGSNPGVPHCRWILNHSSHQGSPGMRDWVAYPFSRDLPNPGIKMGSPALQAGSLPA